MHQCPQPATGLEQYALRPQSARRTVDTIDQLAVDELAACVLNATHSR